MHVIRPIFQGQLMNIKPLALKVWPSQHLGPPFKTQNCLQDWRIGRHEDHELLGSPV